MPNKLTQFWHDLKRRGVVKVITMYAATAFIIMEAAEIMLPRLGLPDWTVTLVIILLIVGFPVAVILSWIFDFTSEGVQKTEPIRLTTQERDPERPVKRRLRIGDLIITVLVVIVIILAFPKIFKGSASLYAMTNTTTVLNEYGEKERRQVFKDAYVQKIMIYPFLEEERDSINQWLKQGIPEGVREDLLQFHYVLTYGNSEAIHLQEQISAAKIYNCPYFLTGTYKVTDGYYKITSRLYETKNGSVKQERVYQGDNLFSLLDSISLQTRLDLNVSRSIIGAFPDLPFQEHTTANLTAYKYYIFGQFPREDFSPNGVEENYYKALELDSTFALASYRAAWECHFYQKSKIDAKNYIRHASRHRQRLPEYRENQIRVLNYSILGENEMAIALSEMQYELQPYNIELLLTLIDVYNTNFLIAKAEDAIEKLNALVPDYPDYQFMRAQNYLLSDKVNEGLKYIKKRVGENPGYAGFHLSQGQFYLHLDDLDNAEKTFNGAILHAPENEEMWLLFLDHINFARSNTLTPGDLQKFAGRYRLDVGELYYDNRIYNDHLFSDPANQLGYFAYPVSDTSFIGDSGDDIYIISSFSTNGQGEVYKVTELQSNIPNPYTSWKQDDLILYAEKSLESERHQEALIAFQKAFAENPEHYYLLNYIKHLEFIQSQEYKGTIPVLESYTGTYGNVKVFKKNDQLYVEPFLGLNFKILPMSEDQFMIPSSYFTYMEFLKENNQIMGVKAIMNDGREFITEKTSDR